MKPEVADLDLIEASMLKLAATTGPDKTFCPSEVARAVAGNHPDQWGPLMQPVRKVAVRLAVHGSLVVLRKGRPVDPRDFKGVYRLAPTRDE